ncbi:MAG: choice-of-anchor B family protein, partial [Psychrosphaera sp.]|nr:choice-of-anchor B family protein [Psychrosphaera sp.]
MKPVRFMLNATSLAMLSLGMSGLYSGSALAHAEHDKPRYISSTGVDKGACEALESPCLTFRYTANQSNKGDQILVASGKYAIDDADSLFYLLSEIVPVKAGFSTKDGYKVRDQQANTTHLTGVPLEFAQQLRAKGFVVNTDQKNLSTEAAATLAQKLIQYKSLSQSQADVDCVDGQAGQFACNNIKLLSHVPLTELSGSNASANDIWGFIDLNNNREYAIIGLRNGVAAVDVTNPVEPNVVGYISASNTTWRDIKVHQYYDAAALRWKAYAYVTADSASIGLTIVDLNDLSNGISIVNIDRTDTSAHNVFLSNVDYSTGVTLTGRTPVLHTAGASNAGGAFNSYQMGSDSTTVSKLYHPGFVASYTHDMSAMVISDDRINSQCNPVNGSCEIFFDYNVDRIKIWDKSNNASPTLLGSATYSNPGYVHSGWSTEDNQVVIVHDELDEAQSGINSTVRFFDISNMAQPQMIAQWVGPTGAIDHNGFVRGSRYYMSNYERGLTVLDISNPASPQEIGHFDTFPLSDNTNFNGAWGVYPYLPSGNILVSDINSGLYVLGDNTVGMAEHDSVKLSASTYQVEEGNSVTVNVQRIGDTSKAVTVQYESHVGSAGTDDFAMVQGTLSWSAGETDDKPITIVANTDGLDGEYNETL